MVVWEWTLTSSDSTSQPKASRWTPCQFTDKVRALCSVEERTLIARDSLSAKIYQLVSSYSKSTSEIKVDSQLTLTNLEETQLTLLTTNLEETQQTLLTNLEETQQTLLTTNLEETQQTLLTTNLEETQQTLLTNLEETQLTLLTNLEETGTIRSSPGIEEVVFASGYEPLASVGKLERQDTRLVQVKLVFLRAIDVQHLHVTALHAASTKGDKEFEPLNHLNNM